MAEHELVGVARGVVDAFNASDWEACKAALASDSVYDEVGHFASYSGGGQYHPMLAGLEAGHAGRQGYGEPGPGHWQHRGP